MGSACAHALCMPVMALRKQSQQCYTRAWVHDTSVFPPCMQVPTLKTPNGGVFESNAIARYIARLSDTGLFGDTLLDAVSLALAIAVADQLIVVHDASMRLVYVHWSTSSRNFHQHLVRSAPHEIGAHDTQAFVESWIDFSTTEIDGPLGSWVYPHFGILPYDKKVCCHTCAIICHHVWCLFDLKVCPWLWL